MVARLHRLAPLRIFLGMGFSIFDHAIDFVLVQTAGTRNGDLLLLVGAQILGLDAHDAIGINVEGHLNLGDTPRRRRNALQVKAAEGAIVPCHLAFALQHVNLDTRLIVRSG